MGMAISNLVGRPHNCRRDIRILLLGLDASGKTTLLYRLRYNTVLNTIPTIGFNVETIETTTTTTTTVTSSNRSQVHHFTVWDISGSHISLWRHYFAGTAGLIFVIDSTDYARFEEAKEALWWVLRDSDNMQDTQVVLVFANKQDGGNAMTVGEVKEALDLENLPGVASGRRRWHIQGSSAFMGEGFMEGLEWLGTQFEHGRLKTLVPETSTKITTTTLKKDLPTTTDR
ncbi:hypothetical protein BGX29_010057 [Mortierella sp. GBA35]|nr:hypothetical protein BGX29_010057 [Mortierella sp. GBA35]